MVASCYKGIKVFDHITVKRVSWGDNPRPLIGDHCDPLTSILPVLARSCQILTTSWQPWKIIYYSEIVSYHDGQNSKIIKNTRPSVQAAETLSKG